MQEMHMLMWPPPQDEVLYVQTEEEAAVVWALEVGEDMGVHVYM